MTKEFQFDDGTLTITITKEVSKIGLPAICIIVTDVLNGHSTSQLYVMGNQEKRDKLYENFDEVSAIETIKYGKYIMNGLIGIEL